MAHKNQKNRKEKEYNPFATKAIKRETIGVIKCYTRAVKPNPKDVFGVRKQEGLYYNQDGYNVTSAAYGAERYEPDRVYYYEVGANDGSYRKCTAIETALQRFAQLVEFEKRQTQMFWIKELLKHKED